MKIFKSIIIVIVAIQSIVNTYGQCALVDKTMYIFEGKESVADADVIPFRDTIKGEPHTARKVLVTAIYKNGDGKLKLGTIQIIDDYEWYTITNGIINDVQIFDWTPPEKNGVYFCSKNETTFNKFKTDNNSFCFKQSYGTGFNFERRTEDSNPTKILEQFKAFGRWYDTKEDFYLDLSQCPNTTVPDSLTQKKSPNERRMKDWHSGITRFYDTLQYYIDTLSSNWNYEQYLENFNGYTQDILLELGNDILPFTEPSRGSCRDLFISEYVCGTGSNQSIELFNPTSSSISLSHYYLKIFPNGSASPLTINLSGSVPSHNTYIISNFII